MLVVFGIIVLLHGLIHLMGFAKAFNFGNIDRALQPISKIAGIVWLFVAVLFTLLALLIFIKNPYWSVFALIAIVCSQVLILISWQDSKYGTIANALILVVAIAGIAQLKFRNNYYNDVQTIFLTKPTNELLTERDIEHLPFPIIKYLHYTRVIGKPNVFNFYANFNGLIRSKTSEWMDLQSEQYNAINIPSRFFFMDATMKHLPVAGYHCYKNGNASMDIRLLSISQVEHQAGNEMNEAETVTFFNDMCCLAPATLIDRRIKWTEADSTKVKAQFTINNITINAWLYFNVAGELINFTSENRYALMEDGTMKQLKWSTPLSNYKLYNGVKLASEAQLWYQYPGENFCYGRFTLKNVSYNLNSRLE